MKTIIEIFKYFILRKKILFIPFLIIALIFGFLIILTSSSTISPFIYTLF